MGTTRLNILNSKRYLKKYTASKYKPTGNSNFYLASYTKSVGHYLLNNIFYIKNKRAFENIKFVMSDIYFGINYSIKIVKNEKFRNTFSKIVLSWGFKKDFNNKGSFYDKYFNTNSSNQKKILWLIIYLDEEIPKKIQPNMILIKVKGNKLLNILSWFKFLLLNITNLFKGFDYFLVNISSYSFLSKKILSSLKKILLKDYDEIIMPYEGQPFQNEIIRFIKNKNTNTLTTGYIHSPPLAVPTNFIHKQFSPDRIFLNGKDQLFCFEKFLGWPKKKLNYIPSLRFRKTALKQENKIFIPYVVREHDKVLSMIKYIHNNVSNLNGYIVQNHPAAKNSKSNLELISKIEKILSIKSFLKKKIYDLVLIGNSGGISELLERNYSVIHICEDPEFECFSGQIWKSIRTIKISRNIFTYKLKNKGNLIKFGKKNTDLNLILEN